MGDQDEESPTRRAVRAKAGSKKARRLDERGELRKGIRLATNNRGRETVLLT
jgi:hypothetical protein